jgi:hypothetical protein
VQNWFRIANGCAQKAENGFGFYFFRAVPQDGNELINHILRVTGDGTWVSFVNVKTKEQS